MRKSRFTIPTDQTQSQRLAAILVGSALLAGCGTASPGDEKTSATSDKLVDDFTGAAIAGEPIAPPALAAGGCTPSLTWNVGGTLLSSPHVHMVHWGAFWASGAGATQAATDVSTWSKLATDSRFWAPLAEYVTPGGVAIAPERTSSGAIAFGSGTDPNALDGMTADSNGIIQIAPSDISRILTSEFQAGILPDPTTDSSTIYVVMLPQSTDTTSYPSSGFFGYHNAFQYTSSSGVTTWAIYAMLHYDTAILGSPFPTVSERNVDLVIAHEVNEAATRPLGGVGIGGWVNACPSANGGSPPGGGSEIGDMCNRSPTAPIDGFVVQQEWSNAAGGCVDPAGLIAATPVAPVCSSSSATTVTCTLSNPSDVYSISVTGDGLNLTIASINPYPGPTMTIPNYAHGWSVCDINPDTLREACANSPPPRPTPNPPPTGCPGGEHKCGVGCVPLSQPCFIRPVPSFP